MTGGKDVNADLGAHVIMHTRDMAWQETGIPGLWRKRLELIQDGDKARETYLARFDPGAALPEFPLDARTEIMVLDGEVSDGRDSYAKGVYVRLPPEIPVRLSSETGCVIFVRKRSGVGIGGERIVRDSNAPDAWQVWGERGSHKVQLYDPGELPESSWLGRMLPDMHIPEHDHPGGEEIFVIEGAIEDEHGVAGPGTWIRFPVGFRHAPFSHGEDCVMIVRAGDVI